MKNGISLIPAELRLKCSDDSEVYFMDLSHSRVSEGNRLSMCPVPGMARAAAHDGAIYACNLGVYQDSIRGFYINP